MTELVQTEIADGVALLRWHRPERNNAWSGELRTAYFDALEAVRDDDAVRAIVVTGTGRFFCPGADMNMLASGEEKSVRRDDPRPETLPITVPKPMIAAINGACAGIGFVHTLLCDMRFAAADVKITTSFARLGLVAAQGSAWLLPRIVGVANAMDLLMSGRVLLADEAHELGLVNRVHPPDELLDATLDYARELASHSSPTSMGVMKRQVYGDLHADLEESRQIADALMHSAQDRADRREGVAAFRERRAPRFGTLDRDALPAVHDRYAQATSLGSE